MEIPLEDLAFMDDDKVVFTEGIKEHLEKFERTGTIEPITVFLQVEGTYYARGGRHRAYMAYHKLDLRTIEVEILENFPLHERDYHHLKNGCVRVKDLKRESLYDDDENNGDVEEPERIH